MTQALETQALVPQTPESQALEIASEMASQETNP